MSRLEVDAKIENLDRVNEFISDNIIDCPVKDAMQIELVVEEIFVNIAHYAYEGKGDGKAWVNCEFDEDKRLLEIIFEDKGIPFNPLEKEDPDVTASAEEREIGGLGIFLTKKLMDEVKYEYKDDCNILTVVKKL
ncbi:MAG: ATP-binding protein [Firmicutes bacterium]|nr:ATP-binding protein [Bacillota bacterium]